MISRDFIYEFSNFDDISARENDKKTRAHDFFRREMGVKYPLLYGVLDVVKIEIPAVNVGEYTVIGCCAVIV